MFVFLSSHLFYPVSHCFRGSFKKNLKAYDVNNCLRCDTETLSINKILNREHFYGKITENVHQKLAPDPFLILLYNQKQPLYARNSLLNKIF